MAHPYQKFRDGAAKAERILKGDGGTVLAGDVEPIRPILSPASNAGRQNQIKNQQRQRPNLSDPANANIKQIYG